MLTGPLQGSAGAAVGREKLLVEGIKEWVYYGSGEWGIIPAPLTALEMMQTKGDFLAQLVCWFVVLLMAKGN